MLSSKIGVHFLQEAKVEKEIGKVQQGAIGCESVLEFHRSLFFWGCEPAEPPKSLVCHLSKTLDTFLMSWYLLKLPSQILEEWNNIKEPGEILGHLDFAKGSTSSSSSSTSSSGDKWRLRLDSRFSGAEKYAVCDVNERDMARMASRTLVFSGSSNRDLREGKFEGEITKVFTVTPARRVAAFSSTMTKRARLKKKQRRTIMKLSAGSLAQERHADRLSALKRKREMPGRPEKKARKELRVKKAKDEVQEMILQAFKTHQYYSAKQLQAKTGQPMVYLKEILRDLCDRHDSGEHKHQYSLKELYKDFQ
jgi:hypothetical protein